MLNNTLNTNEVKDASGAEVEFERISIQGTSTIFKKITETAGLPYRLKIAHTTSGTGKNAVRRSVVRFEKTSENTAGDKVPSAAQLTLIHPEGVADNYDDAKALIANIMSFCATTGAATTVLFDCTGNGAKTLLDQSL